MLATVTSVASTERVRVTVAPAATSTMPTLTGPPDAMSAQVALPVKRIAPGPPWTVTGPDASRLELISTHAPPCPGPSDSVPPASSRSGVTRRPVRNPSAPFRSSSPAASDTSSPIVRVTPLSNSRFSAPASKISRRTLFGGEVASVAFPAVPRVALRPANAA